MFLECFCVCISLHKQHICILFARVSLHLSVHCVWQYTFMHAIAYKKNNKTLSLMLKVSEQREENRPFLRGTLVVKRKGKGAGRRRGGRREIKKGVNGMEGSRGRWRGREGEGEGDRACL